jgi:two-component system, LytTR family, sensor kinase
MTAYADSWLNSLVLRTFLAPSRRERIAMHLVCWLGIALFTLYAFQWNVLRGADWQTSIVIIVANVATVAVSYYVLTTIGLYYLYRNRWLPFLTLLLAIYVGHTYATYTVFHFYADQVASLRNIMKTLGAEGAWAALFRKHTFLMNWSFTISALMFPVAAKSLKDMLNQQQQRIRLERDNLKLELQFLQSQIQPHFILNALNSVYATVAGVNDEAGAMLVRLSELMRYALYETTQPTVALEREVNFLHEYTLLEAARQHERATLSFQHEGDLRGYRIPPMLLIAFVENAFKHGVNATYRQAWALFRLTVSDTGLLYFHVSNSLPIHTTKQRSPRRSSSGLGIENTRRRLAILFPDQYTLRARQTNDEFIVELTIQLERHPHPAGEEALPTSPTWNKTPTPA